MPIWVGPQAPCVNQSGLAIFTPSNAAALGTANATSAAQAMANYGLAGTLVFYNMENYTPTGSCSAAVRSFLTAWVEGMNANGFQTTAVYGNPAPAQYDFSTISGLTEVWIASYGSNNINAPNVTTWGMAPLCDPFSSSPCSLWSNHQRIRQYLGNQSVYYGDNNLYQIDFDAVDAQVVGPEASLPESPTYDVAIIGTGTSTTPSSINDEGVVVGSAQVGSPSGGCNVIGWCGFIYSNGGYTWAQNQDQGEPMPTQFTGVNDLGTVVGYNGSLSDNSVGFTYQAGVFTTTIYPGADNTQLLGINDDGQIVGYWFNDSGTSGYFVHSADGFMALPDYPGEINTNYYTINGNAELTGTYYDPSLGTISFIYDLQSGTFALPIYYPGATYTRLTSNISNNGQVAGVAILSSGSVYFIYDENSNGFTPCPRT